MCVFGVVARSCGDLSVSKRHIIWKDAASQRRPTKAAFLNVSNDGVIRWGQRMLHPDGYAEDSACYNRRGI
jgi:hypothetical protein